MKAPITLFAFAVSLLWLLGSCAGIKPGSRSGGKKLYETFYVGNEGTQYFIKPLLFTGRNNSTLNLDITFRHKTELQNRNTLNFTVESPELLKNLDSLTITNKEQHVRSTAITLLFSERVKTNFASRFTTSLTSGELQQIFNTPNWTITLYQGSNKHIFTATPATHKKLASLHYHIFSIL